ncbi:hypothetical protein HMPREF0240_04457 [Clostridium sp. D5]|nr:hypothetical protein HMPREF0240_04457 [Clostridium sp. D5]
MPPGYYKVLQLLSLSPASSVKQIYPYIIHKKDTALNYIQKNQGSQAILGIFLGFCGDFGEGGR